MGNAIKCQTCAPAVNHSVFTFSEDLVLKIAEGRPPRPLTAKEMASMDAVGDQELFDELRCIDDTHTKAYGLTQSRVQLMLERLEQVVDDLSINSTVCESEVVAKCYQFNKECPSKCAENVAKFDDCVDETTRERIEEVIKQDKF